jgi:hypothetical protein
VSAMKKGWIDRVFANGVAYRYPDVPAWSGPRRTSPSSSAATGWGPRPRPAPADARHARLHGDAGARPVHRLRRRLGDDATGAGYLAELDARLRAVR